MLTTHPVEGKLRAAWNLFQRADGELYTRPGALQVLTQPCGKAVAWGDRVLAEQNTRLVLWAGGTAHDIGPKGYTLQAVPFQAITGSGAREDRLYVADGLNPLYYLAKSGDTYAATEVVNECLDGSSAPYDIPVPFSIAAWRNRLWIGDGTHRIYHCQNDKPHYWDPLWEIQLQGSGPDAVRRIEPLGEALAVGLEHSWKTVQGTSHLNWVKTDTVQRRGVCGWDASVSYGGRVWYADGTGLFELGADNPMSEALRDLFEERPAGVQVALWPARRLLFVNLTGRVFVMHIDRPGEFTELHGFPVYGVFAGEALAGWYGPDGLWLYGQDYLPDEYADGSPRAIVSRFDGWDVQPKTNGSGRALCRRTLLVASGKPSATATYTCRSDEDLSVETFDLSPAAEPLDEVAGVAGDFWPFARVRRELVPSVPGERFRHIIESTAPFSIHSFDPQYR